MGGSSGRRQRSTSETRRRRRQCLTDDETTATTTSIHGLPTVLIWILATSSLIVVYSPATSNHYNENPLTAYDRLPTEKLISDDISPFSKMEGHHYHYEQHQHHHQQQPLMMPKSEYPIFSRPQGLRYRGDDHFLQMLEEQRRQQNSYQVMPVLTEHQPSHNFGMPSTSNHQGTSYGDYGTQQQSPSIEDLDLIDCMWRNDVALEKGTTPVAPADQCDSDLVMLTQKSAMGELNEEDTRKYESLSKDLFTGFYEHWAYPKGDTDPMKSSTQHPTQNEPEDQITGQDLEELLKDVSDEESVLNKAFESNTPVLNNVSLSDATVYTAANYTERREMQETLDLSASGVVPSSQAGSLLNQTDAVTAERWAEALQGPENFFPPGNYDPLHQVNATGDAITSNGSVAYDHAYTPFTQSSFSQLDNGVSSSGRQQQTQTSPNSADVTASATHSLFDSYHEQRHSMSDYTTDSSSPCSRSSQSPTYEAHDFRMDGKLVPRREHQDYGRSSPSTKINRVITNGQRKRGRQSKDEQLAQDHGLPVTAMEISEMSLSELQNVLKMEELTEYQRQLIRKIRRRGKNKVAARTCRQRRTDRHDKVSLNHYI